MKGSRSAVLALSLTWAAGSIADTLVVPDDFASIQAAVDAAEPADTVLVEPGTYTENLSLGGNVEVRGRETARTLLAPEDDALAAVSIVNVTGARFANFTLIDAGTGVAVTGSSGIEITNVVFDRSSEVGLTVDIVSSVEALHNVFFENDTAISRGSTNVQVENNIFLGNETTIAGLALPGVDPFGNVLANCFFANGDVQDGGTEAGFGLGATVGDPLFVDPAGHDFHLREGSACIDVGRGIDVVDNSTADAGAYGGPLADAAPFPVDDIELSDSSSSEPASIGITAAWPANLDYRVTNTVAPGGYRVYYKQGGEPAPPFDGTDAGGGTAPSPIDVGNVTTYTLENLSPQAATVPVTPRLSSASGRNESAVLAWEPSPGATGYRVHYGVDAVAENAVDVGDVTSFTVTGLANATTYRFAVSALNQPAYHVAVAAVDNTQNRNESELTEVASLAVGTPLESVLSAELTATPGATEPYPDLPDEGCFIATAAFGAQWTAEVQVLREFRDRYLATHAAGRWLVARYYALGPGAAAWLNEREALKPLVRAALLPAVGIARLSLATPPAASAAAVAFVVLVVLLAGCRNGGMSRLRRRFFYVAFLTVAAGVPSLHPTGVEAQQSDVTQQASAAMRSPRWMYELKLGYFYPDLPQYDVFYGDDRDTFAAVAGSYRVRDWLEIGGEIGHMQGEGFGIAAGSADPGAEVTLRSMPLQVFATFIYPPTMRWRFMPYAGIGVASVWYEQDIELQPGRDGHTDVGAAWRAGLRWFVMSEGPRASSSARRDSIYWRSFVFLEAQGIDAEIDDIDLGGDSYLLGFRMEFELGR